MTRHRIGLSLPLALLATSLGCAHPKLNLDDLDLVEDCADDNILACAAMIDPTFSLELAHNELGACQRGNLDACERVGPWLVALGQPRLAAKPFELACGAHRDQACVGWVRAMLATHDWLRRCAAKASPSLGASVTLPLTLVPMHHGSPTRVRLRPLPAEVGQLRPCVEQVLAHTDFPTIEGYWYDLDFDLELGLEPRLPISLPHLGPWHHTQVTVEAKTEVDLPACDADGSCEVIMAQAVYSPDPSELDLLEAGRDLAERAIHFTVEYCIDTNGKVEQVQSRSRLAHREVAHVAASRVRKWRYKPRVVDGERVLSCRRTRWNVEYRWDASLD